MKNLIGDFEAKGRFHRYPTTAPDSTIRYGLEKWWEKWCHFTFFLPVLGPVVSLVAWDANRDSWAMAWFTTR
jgi:hypothetical protein